MNETKKALENLGVLTDIEHTLATNNIEQTDENLTSSGFGFAKITESFEATLILSKEVYDFVAYMRKKQAKDLTEQPFALIGNLDLDSSNNPLIYLNKFIEDTDGVRKETHGRGGDSLYKKVNEYLNNNENINKVLLMGHTHPDMEKLSLKDGFIDNNAILREAFETITGNPLELRKRGLNVSVGDIVQLISTQNSASRANFILLGIALPNDELNVLFYNGTTIQSLDNIFVVRGKELESIPNFRHSSEILKSV